LAFSQIEFRHAFERNGKQSQHSEQDALFPDCGYKNESNKLQLNSEVNMPTNIAIIQVLSRKIFSKICSSK
jgi:hypothetical protein